MSETQLRIQYPIGVVEGAHMSILGTANAPTVEIAPSAVNCVFLMWDPDAVTPSYIHWLIVDIPPEARSVAQGRVVVPYMGPAPPPGTGKHRYYFALFEGNASAPSKRAGFDPRAWQKENNLRWVAWNGFTTQAPTV